MFGPARLLRSLFVLALLGIAACSAPQTSGFNDPFEPSNRRVHAFNKQVDQTILRPISRGVSSTTDGPLSQGVSNFATNLNLPGDVANDLLQLKLDDAFTNSARFALNTTFGLGGLFDVATPNGLAAKPTDFGETLHIWGMPEGPYLELPILSASTTRDTIGLAVDYVLDPVNFVVPTPQRHIGTLAKAMNSVSNRGRYSDLFDQVLYQSEDSYAQTRLVYLQSRRQKLHGGLTEADLEDPYAE